MSDGLDIAFFGSSLVSSWWNGACTYYRGILRGLAERGHRVTFYEPDAYERQTHRDIEDPPYARVVVYDGDRPEEARQLVRAAGADVVVKTSGVGVFDELLEAEVSNLSGSRTVRVFWDVDAPATLARVEADHHDPLRDALPRYDLVLTYGGGEPVVRRYLELGARDCRVVYNALDPTTHYAVEAADRYRSDCNLLANRLPDREERIDEYFVRAAWLAPGKRFVLGGNGWEDKRLPPNVVVVGHVPTTLHNAFNCSATTVLNVTRESMAANGWSPATRVFEAAGAGACLVTDHWRGIEDFFEPGSEVLVANDGADVAHLVSSTAPGEAAAVGRRAARRALAEHTYDRRSDLVDELLRAAAGRRDRVEAGA